MGSMNPAPIHVGPTYRQVAEDIGRMPIKVYYRGEARSTDQINWVCRPHHEERLWAEHKARGYTGPNQRLGDYFIREFARMGTDRRQVVQYLVVGTGRIEQMPRSRFEKMVRPA